MKDLIVHLSLIDGVGPAAINKILQSLSAQQINQIYTFKMIDFVALCGFTPSLASKLVTGLSDKKLLERELTLAEKHEIQITTVFDDEYPSLLKQIYLPPPLLYSKGIIQASKTLAVVGSRKAQTYAHRALTIVLPPVIAQGWSIVSGGALGADTYAHQITLKERGVTYVVLGSGLLRRYPLENSGLFDRVVENGGAVISCFSLEQSPLPGNFPARNRIIAGLSRGCVVVQAAKKSGASITAMHALEQGREVFVIPGSIDDSLNEGSHALIQQGAKLIHSADDIMIEFNEHYKDSIVPAIQINSCEKNSNIFVQEQSPEEAFLLLFEPAVSIEDLAFKTGNSLFSLQAKLFDLQLEGKITQNFAGLWQRV